MDKVKSRPHLWLIAVIGVIVPRRLRADWRQEWEAELRYRERLLAEWDRLDWRNKLELLRRSASAFWDALVLQPQRLEDEMFQDLRSLAGARHRRQYIDLQHIPARRIGVASLRPSRAPGHDVVEESSRFSCV